MSPRGPADGGGGRSVGGALLVYRRPVSRWFRDASTVGDHISAFGSHSRFPIYAVNTELGFPRGLGELRFDAIVMHYSLFAHGEEAYPFPREFGDYLDASPEAYKIAFFQDEYMFWGKRASFLNAHRFDCVFTLLEPVPAARVYGHHTEVGKLVSHLPGYVSEEMVSAAERHRVPAPERAIDVGYRARPLDPWMGTDEKAGIGIRFAELAAGSGLRCDIDVTEQGRLYGEDWYRFLAGCRCFLGVESGTRAFDLTDEVYREWAERSRRGEPATIEDLRGGALDRWEDRIPYRTISPRHFEAAALGVCQVLFEGSYSGLMEPLVHYIPLRKDFSDFELAVERIRDRDLCGDLAANARRDLIDSGANTYARFIAECFDPVLAEAGVAPEPRAGDAELVARSLRRTAPARAAGRLRSTLSYHPRLQPLLYPLSRPVVVPYRRLRARRAERRRSRAGDR